MTEIDLMPDRRCSSRCPAGALPADPGADCPCRPTPFEAPKYGVKVAIPKDWPIAVREEEDRVFVALIPQDDPERPGVVACELGLAPRTSTSTAPGSTATPDGAAGRGRRSPGTRSSRGRRGDRLETLWEFRPAPAGSGAS